MPVYLTAYALHTRLALPDPDAPDAMIEYGFGDWRYYALGSKGPWNGFRALFFSRAAAMSRRRLSYDEDPVLFARNAWGERSVRILVERERADALRERLEGAWDSLGREGADSVFRPGSGVALRKSGEAYGLFRNSNHRSASWLRELGNEVRGPTVLNKFRVAPAE